MSTVQPRFEFAPPPTPGLPRAVALAVVAHALLLTVLAVGVRWKHDAPVIAIEAELWSELPQVASPPQQLESTQEPVPPIAAKPPQPVPLAPDPAIAIAKEKERQRELQQKTELQEQRRHEALRAQQAKADKDARDKAKLEKLAQDKKRQDEAKRSDAVKAQAETQRLAELRKQQMERIARMAGQTSGNGNANSAGNAARASGPSATYAGRIAARIKPNITYIDTVAGNPAADIEVRTSPDGTIISRKLTKSSGIRSWDEAVLSAIDKTEKIPADVDGRVVPVLTLSFRPRD